MTRPRSADMMYMRDFIRFAYTHTCRVITYAPFARLVEFRRRHVKSDSGKKKQKNSHTKKTRRFVFNQLQSALKEIKKRIERQSINKLTMVCMFVAIFTIRYVFTLYVYSPSIWADPCWPLLAICWQKSIDFLCRLITSACIYQSICVHASIRKPLPAAYRHPSYFQCYEARSRDAHLPRIRKTPL